MTLPSRILLLGVLAGCASEPRIPSGLTAGAPVFGTTVARVPQRNTTPVDCVLDSLMAQTKQTRRYDSSYTELEYPNGDVPVNWGVCSDVIVRAFRAGGVDLQEEVHEDMSRAFTAYPQLWGHRRPDRNIDHRRVANLMQYFQRDGKAQRASPNAESYRPADIVAWELPGGRLHVGMVVRAKTSDSTRHLIVHNIGAGAILEDRLFTWKIIGHYRWFAP